jgi:hypothetical protein
MAVGGFALAGKAIQGSSYGPSFYGKAYFTRLPAPAKTKAKTDGFKGRREKANDLNQKGKGQITSALRADTEPEYRSLKTKSSLPAQYPDGD